MAKAARKPIEKILLVVGNRPEFERIGYFARQAIPLWRADGLQVEVVERLETPVGDDTLVFPHIDLTIRPPDQAAIIDQCPNVINRAVTDISKRHVSRMIIGPDEEYDGPVIVKSNANWGGFRESLIEVAKAAPGGTKPEPFVWRQYKVFDHLSEVDPEYRNHPLLVVEKFRPEMRDGLYCLRQYGFFGDIERTSVLMSPDPIVKSNNVVRKEIVDGRPPPEVLDRRRELGFDYGKFDYVVHDGEPIVFDVNATWTYRNANPDGSINPEVSRLIRGVYGFLRRE